MQTILGCALPKFARRGWLTKDGRTHKAPTRAHYLAALLAESRKWEAR